MKEGPDRQCSAVTPENPFGTLIACRKYGCVAAQMWPYPPECPPRIEPWVPARSATGVGVTTRSRGSGKGRSAARGAERTSRPDSDAR